MARLLVGLPALQGDLEKYAKRFDLVEVCPAEVVPKPATLRRWRKAVPPSFVFSVVLPPAVAELTPGPPPDAARRPPHRRQQEAPRRGLRPHPPGGHRPLLGGGRPLGAGRGHRHGAR